MNQTIRQKIVTDEELADFIDHSLVELPKRITDAKNAVAKVEFDLAYSKVVDDAKAEVNRLEGEALFEVGMETNGDGKKKYANEAQRQAAVNQVLASSTEFKEAVNQLRAAERAHGEMKMELAKANALAYQIQNEFAAALRIGDIIAGLCHEDKTVERLDQIGRLSSLLTTTAEEITKVSNVR